MAIAGIDIVNKAKTALGTRYEWGGDSLTKGIDCSGLVQQVYGSFGIQLPRVTYDQINSGANVQIGNLTPGDLVFFDTDKAMKGPDHVGIYIGNGQFIHAPHTGDVVKVSSLTDSYYANRFMGGRRISGVAGAEPGQSLTSGGTEALGEAQVHLSPQELAERYGMSYAFFKSQPELLKLLNSAVSDQWTADRFTTELKNTEWWKTNSDTARQAQVAAKTDPATYKANISAAQFQARDMAVKAGAILSESQVSKLAHNIVDYGWQEAQVDNFLGQYVDFAENHTMGGQAGQAVAQLRQYAYNQGLKISDETLKNAAAYLVRGITTMPKIQDGLLQQTISTYPGWKDQLMAGATMRDIAQPYIQQTAQELELPDTGIDVWHPKVQQALNAQDAQGQPAPMSLGDYQRLLRTSPDWRKTLNAQNQTMAVGHQVLQSMGLVN